MVLLWKRILFIQAANRPQAMVLTPTTSFRLARGLASDSGSDSRGDVGAGQAAHAMPSYWAVWLSLCQASSQGAVYQVRAGGGGGQAVLGLPGNGEEQSKARVWWDSPHLTQHGHHSPACQVCQEVWLVWQVCQTSLWNGRSCFIPVSEETKTKSIKCIAAGAHFQPKFNWFLENLIIKDVEISDSKENVEDGKVNFMSSLVYKGDHKDFNKTLKCEVEHKGHTDTHLEDENNIAKAVLNLRFEFPKIFLLPDYIIYSLVWKGAWDIKKKLI